MMDEDDIILLRADFAIETLEGGPIAFGLKNNLKVF
jgi:hypothetical protein